MLRNGMKCIPVLILKCQRHTFSQTNIFFQINKFFGLFVRSQLLSLTYLEVFFFFFVVVVVVVVFKVIYDQTFYLV